MSLKINYRPFDVNVIPAISRSSLTWEYQLLDKYHQIMEYGVDRPDRTSTGTRSVFGGQMRIDLRRGFPITTTKKMGLKSIIAEALWFLEGSSDERRLAELTHGTRDPLKTTIWTENLEAPYWAHKAQFDGDLGRIYGVQWRDWINSKGEHIDQIELALQALKADPYSRRIIVTAWNPGEFDQMVLPPCHSFFQFYMTPTPGGGHELSCHMYQRSVDNFLGKPYNIASYALITHMFAHLIGASVGDLIMSDGDSHIYANHFEQVQEQLIRTPYDPPKLIIHNPESITKLSDFKVSSFSLEGYKHHDAIKGAMAV